MSFSDYHAICPALVYTNYGLWKMDEKSIYSDSLVSIDENTITFRRYYFPTGKSKIVRLSDVERIVVSAPTLRNGKWRIHGTGSFGNTGKENRS